MIEGIILIKRYLFYKKCKVSTSKICSYITKTNCLGNAQERQVVKGPWHHPVTYASKVMVKRVFRGDKDRFEARSVIVEGLGNPKICVSRPKIGDTRIFFVDEIDFEEFNFPSENLTHFRLRSSILRLTLENLRFLWNEEKLRRINATTNSGRI